MSLQEPLIFFILVARNLRLLKASMSLRSPKENGNEFYKSTEATKIEHKDELVYKIFLVN